MTPKKEVRAIALSGADIDDILHCMGVAESEGLFAPNDHEGLEARLKIIQESRATKSGRCKTCQHWSQAPCNTKPLGLCACPKFVYEKFDEETQADGLYYWDYEGYSAGFETGPDFGCVHWEVRP